MFKVIVLVFIGFVVYFTEIIIADNNFAFGIKKEPNFSFIYKAEESKSEFAKNVNLLSAMIQAKVDLDYLIVGKINNKFITFTEMSEIR